jgi:hypothetical protein
MEGEEGEKEGCSLGSQKLPQRHEDAEKENNKLI